MNQIRFSKYRNILKKRNEDEVTNNTKKFLKSLVIRLFVVIIIFLSLSIAYKGSNYMKEKIVKYLYTDDISFTKINNIYNKYLGGILPIKNNVGTERVFNESLKYDNSSIYYDGVRLAVSENYLVPALEEGMVVFVGKKDNYGETIIIEDLNGVRIWYGNINTSSLKLYDYIEEGALVGDVSSDLYLVFSKGNEYLSYEEYLEKN